MNKLKVYHVCTQLNINVLKHIWMNRSLGNETRTTYQSCGMPAFADQEGGDIYTAGSVKSMMAFVEWADVVVIHTTNISHDLMRMDTLGKPKVWVCSDFATGAEVLAEKAAAIVVPSEGYTPFFKDCSVPVKVIYRKVPDAWWPEWDYSHKSEGTLRRLDCTCMPGAVAQEPVFRRYDKAWELLQGNLMVMSTQLPTKMVNNYMTMELCEYDTMLRNMTRFQTCWAGCGTDATTFDIVVNNKYWEAIASGAVPITYRSKEMEELSNLYYTGFDWENDVWKGTMPEHDELDEFRDNILSNRMELVLETELDKWEDVLDCACYDE